MSKRGDPDDFDDEDDDVDPYDEDPEEEEEPAPRSRGSRKKKRRKVNALLDIEAEEDDADDDDEDEEAGLRELIAHDDDDPDINREQEQMRAQRLEHQRALRNDDPGEMERYFREKFGDNDDDDQYDEDAGAPETSGIDQQSLLPTIKDPRLYIVRCKKPGHERKAILQLLQKSFNIQRKGAHLGIFSAVAPEHLKGRIYIEAHSSAQVEYAVNGLDLFSTYEGVKALNLDEMTDVLKAAKRPDKQVVGNWVRISRGDYKGDLAQVCGVREGSTEGQLTIRMIPRLDLKGEKDFIEGVDNEIDDEDREKANGARRKGRPPQKLFDKKELFRLTGSADVYTQRDRQTGEVFEVWNDELYRHGLLYKRVTGKTLITGEQVQPQVEELDLWLVAEENMRLSYDDDPSSMDAEEVRKGLGLDVNSIAGKSNTKLFKGDSVRVTAGEQRGVRGVIVSLDGDVVLLQTAHFPEPLRVSRTHITKEFKIGDHVKVSSGKKAGYAGAIVRVEGDVLTIFTDSTSEEIRALSTQVADSSDLNADFSAHRISDQGRPQYELFDLVQLLSDSHEKGVVIQVRNEGVQILTTRNHTRVLPVAAIKCKLRDISVRAIDSRGNPIAPNDTIHVVSGELKDRQGIVKHVAGPTIVFFKQRDEGKNCGIMAVGAADCVASTAAARRLTSTLHQRRDEYKVPAPIPRGSLGSRGTGGGGGRSRDPLFRKEVKIKSGSYKGLIGRVVDTSETTVRVLLNAQLKEVTVPRTKIRDLSDTGTQPRSSFGGLAGSGRGVREPNAPSMGTDRSSNRAPSYPAQTPRSDSMYRSRTPRVDRYSAQTPRYGMATPRVGSMTPAHNGYGSMTPGRDDFRPGRTPRADDYSSFGAYGRTPMPQTPASDMANPYQPYPADPRTPATPAMGVPRTPVGGSFGITEPRTPNVVEPSTPAYGGLEPRTPAPGMEPTTPAPGMEPRTPAPGQEPRTPAPGVEPSTPMVQEPATPHTPGIVPQTPHVQDEDPAELGYRVLIDVEGLVSSQNNASGVVIDAAVNGSFITVRMLSGDAVGQEIKVPGQEITPVQPRPEMTQRQELVKVLDGPSAGRVGRLQNVVPVGEDALEGYIQFTSGEAAKVDMSLVARCHEA